MDKLSNYEKAKIEADKIDKKIIEILEKGESFRVEAGAGSGKTYSLIKCIEWIQENKWNHYFKKHQNVICITYTNTAADVINRRLKNNSFIIASTIHSFAWSIIKQYQEKIISIIKYDKDFHPKEGDIESIVEVRYELGNRYINDNILYLFHNDVIKLFSFLLDNKKFRNILSNKYPLILIDEYQDSFQIIMEKFLNYFVLGTDKIQFGLFGDAWQTIYQTNGACGLIEHANIVEIKKTSNFRSCPKIVNALNIIRPDLPQISAIDDFDGEVIVIHSNDFCGLRRNDRNFKGDLPQEELTRRIDLIKTIVNTKYAKIDSPIKTLMLTHKVLATQQGYSQILDSLEDKFKEAEEHLLLFCIDIIEPIYNALDNSNMQLLFSTLNIKRYPVLSKNDKIKWTVLLEQLSEVRKSRIIDVLVILKENNLVPIPDKIEDMLEKYNQEPNSEYYSTTIKKYMEIEYKEFIALLHFLCQMQSFLLTIM